MKIPGSIRQILKSVLVNTGTQWRFARDRLPGLWASYCRVTLGFTHRRLSILAASRASLSRLAKTEFPRLTGNTDNAAVQGDEGGAKDSTDLGFTMEILEGHNRELRHCIETGAR